MSGDSPELEALFDSIANASAPVSEKGPDKASSTEDTPELESLFDSIASWPRAARKAPARSASSPGWAR